MRIAEYIPALQWLRGYDRGWLRGDVIAGFTVWVMLVPQSMAYALLAGLPPEMGLYAAIVPPVIYTLFGTSRHLAVGPVAMVSLLVLQAVGTLEPPGTAAFLALVSLLTLMTGLIQLLFGLLRLGFISNFLSHSVINGFTCAAALVIAGSQLKHLLGVSLGNHVSLLRLLGEAAGRIGETSVLTFAAGLSCLGFLLVCKRLSPRFPAAMVVVTAATVFTWAFGLDQKGLAVVGDVPRGLPGFILPVPSLEALRVLWPAALAIVFVGFTESIAVAESIAARMRYRIDPDREFTALGLANIAAAISSGFAVTGGFSRTAANIQAGARSGLATFITSALVLLTVLVLTPLFNHLPVVALAAVIIAAVFGLVDLRTPRRLFRVRNADGWCWVLTFAVTIIIGMEQGILTGLAFSLLVLLWRSARPYTAELGYCPDDGVFQDINHRPQAIRLPGLFILRIDGSLHFANMAFVESRLRAILADHPEVQRVICDLGGVNMMDATAVEMLERFLEEFGDAGVHFVFAEAKWSVREILRRAGWDTRHAHLISYRTLQSAVDETLGMPVKKAAELVQDGMMGTPPPKIG